LKLARQPDLRDCVGNSLAMGRPRPLRDRTEPVPKIVGARLQR
jgi:hypothetical protein